MIQSFTTAVQGMVCPQCGSTIVAALQKRPGVSDVQVNYRKSIVSACYDDALCTSEDLKDHLCSIGYPATKGSRGLWVNIASFLLVFLLVWVLTVIPLPSAPPVDGNVALEYLFIVGFLTSFHCITMCGGIMLSQTAVSQTSAIPSDSKRKADLGLIKRNFQASASYNLGRALSYSAIGAVLGVVGVSFAYAPPVKVGVLAVAGLLVVVMGLRMFGIFPRLTAIKLPTPKFLSLKRNTLRKPLAVGLATGLMPCGALASMWLFAAASGSAISGALSMLSFALGTAPLLIVLGSFGMVFPSSWNKYLLRGSAILVVALGIVLLIKAMKMLSMIL